MKAETGPDLKTVSIRFYISSLIQKRDATKEVLSGFSSTVQKSEDLFFVFRLLFNFSWCITTLSLVPITSFLLVLLAFLVSWTPRSASTATSLLLFNLTFAILSIPEIFYSVKRHDLKAG